MGKFLLLILVKLETYIFFKGNPLNLRFCAIDLGSQVDPNKNRNMTRCCDSPDCK